MDNTSGKGITGVTQLGNTKDIQANYVQVGQFVTVPRAA